MKWMLAATALVLFGAAACEKDPVRPVRVPDGTGEVLVLSTDYATGAVARLLPFETDSGAWQVERDLAPTCGDAVGRFYDGQLYVVNRSACGSVEIIDPSDWTHPEMTVGAATNPQDIAFVSPERAYVSRYETNLLLEINPAARTELGTISLAPLADADTLCEMNRMFVLGNDLFVEVQRLDRTGPMWSPVPPSVLAVVDLTSRTLVDVDPATEGIQGIALQGLNPWGPIRRDPRTGDLLVPETGVSGVLDAGGIERVDPVGRRSRGFLITEEELGGDLVDFALWSDSTAYAVIARPGFRTALVSFNPATGRRTGLVIDSDGYNLADCLVHSSGVLLVADRNPAHPELAGVYLFDARTGAPVPGGFLSTGLPPFELLEGR